MSVLFYIFKFVWNKKLLARYNLRRFQSSDNTKNRVSSCSRSSLSLSDRLTHILAPSLSHTQKHPISLSLYRSLPLSLSLSLSLSFSPSLSLFSSWKYLIVVIRFRLAAAFRSFKSESDEAFFCFCFCWHLCDEAGVPLWGHPPTCSSRSRKACAPWRI